MKANRVVLGLVLTVVLVMGSVAALPAHAQIQPARFTGAESDCTTGVFSVVLQIILVDLDVQTQVPPNFLVTAHDAANTALGSDAFFMEPNMTYNGAITYNSQPLDSVTFRLYITEIPSDAAADVLPQVQGMLLDTITVPVDCGTPLPGCDVLINIPVGSVVGAFVADATTYWLPGKLTSPVITIAATKTAWVIGQDASESYYKIVWVCNYLWVDKATMSPNFDWLWLGRDLPTRIVE